MAKFFNKSKKTLFWPILPISGAKKFFPEKISITMLKLRKKLMTKFRENAWTDRMEGQTECLLVIIVAGCRFEVFLNKKSPVFPWHIFFF